MRLFYHGSQSLRKGRCSELGVTYFVTTRTLEPQTLALPAARDIVVEALQYSHAQEWWEVFGFVVMPNHLHILAKLGTAKGLSDVMASLKKWSARRINPLLNREGHLWQDGYQDESIYGDTPHAAVLEYISLNPVKAGLARQAGEYRWCWVPGWYEGRCPFPSTGDQS